MLKFFFIAVYLSLVQSGFYHLLLCSLCWSFSLFLLFLLVLVAKWFLSLVGLFFFLFLFCFPAIFLPFGIIADLHLVLVTTTIVLVFFVPYIKFVYLACFFLTSFTLCLCLGAVLLDSGIYFKLWICMHMLLQQCTCEIALVLHALCI